MMVMAAVGWFSGCPAFTCAVRAAAGAVILYVLVIVAARVAAAVGADAIVRSMSRRTDRNSQRERPT